MNSDYDDLNDPLPDLGNPVAQSLCCNAPLSTTVHPYCMKCGADVGARPSLPPVAPFKPVLERAFVEPCSKCRGTGVWRPGYPCFGCKGTGKKTFKTAPKDRQAQKASYAAKRQRQRAERDTTAAMFRESHKAELEWLTTANRRQEWLASQGKPTWDFPFQLLEKLAEYGTLTDGQLEAVRKCMARDAQRAAEKAVQRESAAVAVDISKIEEAFATARAKADRRGARGIWMRPLTLRSGDIDVTFSPGSPGSKWEGMVFARAGERKLGFVKGGKYSPAFACTEAEKTAVLGCTADPEGAAKAYGKAWSVCTICGQTLTNDESIARGIGPICAEKYGW